MTATAEIIEGAPGTPPVPAAKAVKQAFTSPWAAAGAVAIAVFWTIPTFGLLVNSFRPALLANNTGWWTYFSHPTQLTLSNYHDVLFSGGGGSNDGLLTYMVNSLAIAIPATVIPIFLASMAAYALSWVRFRGSDVIFFTIFALQVVPLQMALVPLLQMYNGGAHIGTITIIPATHLSGNLAEIWLSHTMFSLPLAVFLLYNFISALPESIIEAARVDGASHLRIYRTIVLPLSTPAIASFAIFQFIWVWNDLLVAITFGGNGATNLPLTGRLQQLVGQYGAQLNLLSAGGFISIVIPMIVFFSMQRFFVRGMLAGSVKG